MDNIALKRIPIEDKSVLRNLMELCQHDYSEFNGDEINEHGLFGYRYIDPYWTEAGRHPFFVLAEGRLAGFALVRTLVDDEKGEPVYSLAEFFILRKYRRQGVGGKAARLVFDSFPGLWRVGQEAANVTAQKFWRTIISDYTQGHFEESYAAEEMAPTQIFRSQLK